MNYNELNQSYMFAEVSTDWMFCDSSEAMGAELSTTKYLYQYLAVGGAYRNAQIWGNKHW